MTILKKLSFGIENCEYDNFLSDEIYSGDIMSLSITVLCSTNSILSIIWSNDLYHLYTETHLITANQFFNKVINVKGSYFQVELTNLLGSTFVLQTFYH